MTLVVLYSAFLISIFFASNFAGQHACVPGAQTAAAQLESRQPRGSAGNLALASLDCVALLFAYLGYDEMYRLHCGRR